MNSGVGTKMTLSAYTHSQLISALRAMARKVEDMHTEQRRMRESAIAILEELEKRMDQKDADQTQVPIHGQVERDGN